MNDSELIRKTLKGDTEAFGILVQRYKTKVFHMAFSMTRNREAADDLTQEIFLKAYQALRRFRFQAEFGTWLYRIAVNHARDFLRREKRVTAVLRRNAASIHPVQEEDASLRERRREQERMKKILRDVLATLPEKYRIILTLRDIQGLAYGDIADILRLSPGTVDSRLFRARRLLRTKISPLLTGQGENHEM